MKSMALETISDVFVREENIKQDRLEQVLADGELILNRVNARLDSIDKRQIKIDKLMNQIDGITHFIEWKETMEGVK